jgi:hypothetical protein
MPVHKPSSRKDLLALYFMVAAVICLRSKSGRVRYYKLTFYGKADEPAATQEEGGDWRIQRRVTNEHKAHVLSAAYI